MKSVFFFAAIIGCFPLLAQKAGWTQDATPLHNAEKAMTDIIVHDVFSPPVASRIYAYANMAAYETLAHTIPSYNPLHTQLLSFPDIPPPAANVIPSVSAVCSFLLVGKQLVFSDSAVLDSMKTILRWYEGKKIPEDVYSNSLAYGKQVADSILSWAAKDHYRETRNVRRYTYLKDDSKWNPTPPGYFAAVEPYWNRIRCIILDSAALYKPPPPFVFSKDTSGAFYRQAYEVYQAGNSLSSEQKAIASFWDCNPFDLKTNGHLYFASKKISPGGHWINITGLACRQQHSSIVRSSVAYTLVSIALFDGFISCWDEKYRSNSIRPETYINRYIDEAWRPLLQTPPFPEYTSGHSVISTAAAVVLTALFGNDFTYDDDTETEFALPVRNYISFRQAAEEAAISRLYGGIHYRSAIVNGQEQGDKIGKLVIRNIHLAKQ